MSYQKAELPKPVSLSDVKEIKGFYLGNEIIDVKGHEKKSLIHKFEGEKDTKITQVWGFDLLDRYLENIPMEVLTKVVYEGLKEDKKADKKAHQCIVYYDLDVKRPEDRKLPF
jgi:hypothetical protein